MTNPIKQTAIQMQPKEILYALFDDSQMPILRISFSDKLPTDDDFDYYLAQFELYLKKEQQYIAVFDTLAMKAFPNRFIAKQASWMQRNEEKLKKYSFGAVFIINNLAIRMVLRAIFLLKTPPVLTHVVATEKEAVAWVEQQLENANISLKR